MSECKTSTETFEIKEKGKTNRVLLNGYWIWWCYQHNQPLAWCAKHNIKQQRDDLLKACKFAKAQIKKGAQKKALPILRAAIAKAKD